MEEEIADFAQVTAGDGAEPSSLAAGVHRDVAPEARRRVLHRLAADIERISGIAITGMLEDKLTRVLASVPFAELTAWAGRLRLLPGDDPEWLSLIESLTVHETFFHRDGAQLDLLSRILRETIAAAAASGRQALRLWSAGCATGEEAYTLTIIALCALRDAGFADEAGEHGIACREPWRVEVLGTDISRLVVARARTAVYSTEGLNPFRDLPGELRRFFPPVRGHATEARRVLPGVTRHVRFRQFNLLADSPPDTGFDVVLCRNVLMYLTTSARNIVQSLCRAALRPGGHLLLGPTDVLSEPAAYEACWGPGAVAYTLKPRR